MTRRMMIGIGAIAAMVALGAAEITRGGPHTVRQPEFAACVQLSTHAEQTRCLAPYVHDAVRSGSTRPMLRALETLVRDGSIDDCHRLAHDIGHAAFEFHGRLSTALHEGGPACLNGYYHGATEAAVRHAAADGAPPITELCTELREAGPAYNGCVHGLGHGLMHLYGNVTDARRECGRLTEDYARGRCVDGVYMENSMRLLDLDHAAYRAAAPRACEGLTLPSDELAICAGQIGEIAMFYYRHDLPSALAVCRAISEGPTVAACEQGARDELATVALERRLR